MIGKRILVCLVAGVFLLVAGFQSGAQEKKKDKDDLERKGTVIGQVTGKDKNWIEIKADGEEKARRYVPRWIGDASGGLEKPILEAIAKTPLGARVKIEWGQDERPRVLSIEILKKDGDKK